MVTVTKRATISGQAAVLRGPIPSDQTDRQRCGRDLDYLRGIGGDPSGVTGRLSDEEADAWYRELLADPYEWVIQADGRAVGTIRLHQVRKADRSARLAIGIFDPGWRARGLGTEATRLLVDYAFGELGLHRVELKVLESNTRARRAYVKAGFVDEGIERDSAFVEGRFFSDVRMSILESENRVAVELSGSTREVPPGTHD